MPKWIKFVLALLLLPVAVAETMAMARVLAASGSADITWIPLLAGFACWLVIFSLLPKPMWVYVLGHELTHALWTWLFGGKVKGIMVSSEGGHVVVSKHNFLIVLAPYFFRCTPFWWCSGICWGTGCGTGSRTGCGFTWRWGRRMPFI